MKTNRIVLGIGLLAGTALGIVSPTLAAPHDRNDRSEARDERHESRDDRHHAGEYRQDRQRHRDDRDNDDRDSDDRDSDTPRGHRNDHHGNRPQDFGRHDNGHHYGHHKNRDGRNNGRWNNRSNHDTPNYGNNRPNYGYNQPRFTGTVTSVRGSQSFDVRIGGTTYNVYTVGGLPRGLNRGDIVRITGTRVGGNDIRNARVFIVDNR